MELEEYVKKYGARRLYDLILARIDFLTYNK